MKFCRNCGTPMEDMVKFCPNCGEQMPILNKKTPEPAAPAQPVQPVTPVMPVYQPVQEPVTAQPVRPVQPEQPVTPVMPVYQPVQEPVTPVIEPAPVYAQPVPEKSKKPGKGIIIGGIAGAIAVCGIAGMFFMRGCDNISDEQKFIDYQKKLLLEEPLTQLEEMINSIGQNEISTDMTITADVSGNEFDEYAPYVRDAQLGLKLDAKDGSFLVEASGSYKGTELLTGTITLDNGVAGIYVPDADEAYYTLNVADFTAKYIGQAIDLSAFKLKKLNGKDYTDVIRSYVDIIFSVVNKDSLTIEKKKNVTFKYMNLDGDYTVLTLKPTQEQIEKMLTDLGEKLKTDQDLRNLIRNTVDLDAVSKSLSAAYGYELDAEAVIDGYISRAGTQLTENAADFAKSAADAGLSWVVAIDGTNVRKITFIANDIEGIIIEADGDASKELDMALYSPLEENFYYSNHYTKDGKKYSGTTDLNTEDNTSHATYSYDLSSKSPLGMLVGKYDITITNSSDGTVTLSSEVTKSGSTYTHDIKAQANGQSVSLLIDAKEGCSAKKPALPPTDITNYSESDFSSLLEKISQNLQKNLLPKIMNLGLF
ncbi:MAG: zinc-ribbon domain-containing protein [Solobacterium sp.]|nr:zinc-ribbon domain-containing protein [Solobacterium sp.]